jgi:hypothetical protein
MTCKDTISCIHEPFGDAWYFGPERLSPRYASDEKAETTREQSGIGNYTYKDVFEAMHETEIKEV